MINGKWKAEWVMCKAYGERLTQLYIKKDGLQISYCHFASLWICHLNIQSVKKANWVSIVIKKGTEYKAANIILILLQSLLLSWLYHFVMFWLPQVKKEKVALKEMLWKALWSTGAMSYEKGFLKSARILETKLSQDGQRSFLLCK